MERKICKNCNAEKDLKKFKPKNLTCRSCLAKRQRLKLIETDPRKHLLVQVKRTSRRRGIECSIDLSDIVIPERCPFYGFQLSFSNKSTYNTPSIDRIDNSKGYVKGNVHVISNMANRIKGDMSIQQIKSLASYLKNLVKGR